MSVPENLQDLYIDELKDLWSANDQMLKFVKKITTKTSDKSLKQMLMKSQEGIVKHTTEEAPKKGPVLDALIIAQYQRMTHYGIAGFGTAAAYAQALSLEDDKKALDLAVKEMYSGDQYGSKLAETTVNLAAKDE